MTPKVAKSKNRTPLTPEEVGMADAMRSAWRKMEPPMDQAECADRIGVSPSMFSHWMNARERVTSEKAPFVASLLGLKAEDISLAYKASNARTEKLQGDVFALRLAVLGIAKTLSARSRDVGTAFDVEIQKAGSELPGFFDKGWLESLLAQIRAARGKEEHASQRAPSRKSSSSPGRK